MWHMTTGQPTDSELHRDWSAIYPWCQNPWLRTKYMLTVGINLEVALSLDFRRSLPDSWTQANHMHHPATLPIVVGRNVSSLAYSVSPCLKSINAAAVPHGWLWGYYKFTSGWGGAVGVVQAWRVLPGLHRGDIQVTVPGRRKGRVWRVCYCLVMPGSTVHHSPQLHFQVLRDSLMLLVTTNTSHWRLARLKRSRASSGFWNPSGQSRPAILAHCLFGRCLTISRSTARTVYFNASCTCPWPSPSSHSGGCFLTRHYPSAS
jgi:hypothetical protein